MRNKALIATVNQHLRHLYTGERLQEALQLFDRYLERFAAPIGRRSALSERTVYLITYGDAFYDDSRPGLQVLNELLRRSVGDLITDIHLLPMFPFSSDDGFAVEDYLKINPELGTWRDIDRLAERYRLMFDFVANHSSIANAWFHKFLEQEAGYQEAYIEEKDDFDTSRVIRPRTSPLFHHYKNDQGKVFSVWTTFSADQVDNNFNDPKTLFRMTKILLTYVARGASSIRLDAVGFLWKKSGTTCMHLAETHEIVRLWRSLLDGLAPNTQIITETNVPETENLSYFGNGVNETNQVYQFPFPPLVLYAMTVNNSDVLSRWAQRLKPVSPSATYFNFLASHDGIGLRPVEGILTETDREMLVKKVLENGGAVSYKTNQHGGRSVYELNLNYGDALKNKGESDGLVARKLIAAHHILFSLLGVPAIYYHSLFGSRSDIAGMAATGQKRRINRERLDARALMEELKRDPYRRSVYEGITKLLKLRRNEDAFNPYGDQEVLSISSDVFALRRRNPQTGHTCLSYTNLTAHEVSIPAPDGTELIAGRRIRRQRLNLTPYGTAWLKPAGDEA